MAFDFSTPDEYKFFLRGEAGGDLGDRYYKRKIDFWDNLIDHITNAA